MHDTPMFVDDFSGTQLARYYEVVPGIGQVDRAAGGLHYRITRAPEGPASAEDALTIDTLGRPQPPTTQAVLRFSGDEWTLEVIVEYDFDTRINGRHAYIWVVPGDPAERTRESVAIIRSADLDPASHRLLIQAHRQDDAPRCNELTSTPGRRHWFRVSRAQGRITVAWSPDGTTFTTALEMDSGAQRRSHCVLVNSSSFAGGAAFVIRTLRLFNARPQEAPVRQELFERSGVAESGVPADEVAHALRAGHDVRLRDCVIRGRLDFGEIDTPIASHMQFHGCTFVDPVLASREVCMTGAVSWENCHFQQVGFSSATFGGSVRFVNSQFTGDARFIETTFRRGANFSGCTFAGKPFFRSARVGGALSFYHASFGHGPDLSNLRVDGDLSLSDVALNAGSLTLQRSQVGGTLRLMTTLQREPQPLGNEVDLSQTTLGALIIGAGDRRNEVEQTGPARWDFPASVSLHRAAIDRFEAYRVHFEKPFDISGATLRSVVSLEQAAFPRLIGEWPVETEFYSCFISHSSRDHAFAASLRAALEQRGVTCWFAPEEMEIGGTIPTRIRDEINRHDKLIVILSKDSLESDWVRQEVGIGVEREQQQRRDVLLPIRLDNALQSTRHAWAASIHRDRHVGDFSAWSDEKTLARAFARLLLALTPKARNR